MISPCQLPADDGDDDDIEFDDEEEDEDDDEEDEDDEEEVDDDEVADTAFDALMEMKETVNDISGDPRGDG